ncbi:TPA: hypothetical protein ACF0Y2_004613, partial [Salmonella enterica]
ISKSFSLCLSTEIRVIKNIEHSKNRSGRISVRYPVFLKNGIIFYIIRSVGYIFTLEVNMIMAEMSRTMRTTAFIRIFLTLTG